MRRLSLVLLLALALAACGRTEAPPSSPEPLPAPAELEDEVQLDRRADGAALAGRLEPVPENADPDRRITLRTAGLEGALGRALEGTTVLDARFVPGGVVVLGADHVLAVHLEAGGRIELDAQVEGPLSVVGTRVAYVRGDFPELELAVADVRSGEARALTQDMAPAWSPALSPTGEEIVFVSGAAGSPRLFRIDVHGGAPRALPPSARFPTSPIAPRWTPDGVLRFEDEQGATTLTIPELAIPGPAIPEPTGDEGGALHGGGR